MHVCCMCVCVHVCCAYPKQLSSSHSLAVQHSAILLWAGSSWGRGGALGHPMCWAHSERWLNRCLSEDMPAPASAACARLPFQATSSSPSPCLPCPPSKPERQAKPRTEHKEEQRLGPGSALPGAAGRWEGFGGRPAQEGGWQGSTPRLHPVLSAGRSGCERHRLSQQSWPEAACRGARPPHAPSSVASPRPQGPGSEDAFGALGVPREVREEYG